MSLELQWTLTGAALLVALLAFSGCSPLGVGNPACLQGCSVTAGGS